LFGLEMFVSLHSFISLSRAIEEVEQRCLLSKKISVFSYFPLFSTPQIITQCKKKVEKGRFHLEIKECDNLGK